MAGLGLQAFIDRRPKGPCPICGLKVLETTYSCPHCGYSLSDIDRELLRVYLVAQRKKGVRRGLVVFPGVIGLLLLFYFWK